MLSHSFVIRSKLKTERWKMNNQIQWMKAESEYWSKDKIKSMILNFTKKINNLQSKVFCFPTNNHMLAKQVDMTNKQNIINKPKQYNLSIAQNVNISTLCSPNFPIFQTPTTNLSVNYMKIFRFSTHYRAKNVPPGGFLGNSTKYQKK